MVSPFESDSPSSATVCNRSAKLGVRRFLREMASRCSTVVTFSDTQESADGHSKFALAGEAVPLPRPSLLRPVAEPGARPAKKREPAPSATRQATRVLPDRGKRLTEDGPSPSQSLTHNAWHRGMEVEFPASAGVDGDERKR